VRRGALFLKYKQRKDYFILQKMIVKKADGNTEIRIVHRCYQDITGRQIFLHADGSYGYKDGSPVKDAAEFNLLPEAQRQIALSWWQRVGEKKSQVYYSQLAEQNKKLAGDFQETLAAQENNTRLDSVLYGRKAIVAGGKYGAIETPKSWMEHGFSHRPDWWGQARIINFANCQYVMQEQTTPEAPATTKDAASEKG